MDDVTPPPASDEFTNTADDMTQKLDAVSENIGAAPDALSQTVENTIDTATQKLDDFINGLDNLLGKL